MKTILVINDNSNAAKHAIHFAALIAQKIQASVLLAKTVLIKEDAAAVLAGDNCQTFEPARHAGFINSPVELMQETASLDISEMDERQLAQMINKLDITMVVKGELAIIPAVAGKPDLNSLLNKIRCPVLLVPENWPIKQIDRLVYIADLRFCRSQIVNFLAQLAEAYDATLSIAHLSAKGIPDMEENFANGVFQKEVYDRLNYKQVHFNNIREKDLKTAVDIIINDMHNDVLALVNHRFHFEEIMGRYLTDALPANLNVPIMIFPY
jgi:hypothetical protein